MEVETMYHLPSPADTPYRTPSSTRSHADDMSPATTPPPPPEDRATKRRSTDSVNPALDDNISPLDPRRFTPTLHASLVSEILSLRRDLENKTNDIEKLEQSLHQAQQHNDTLNSNLLNSNKQTREIKRQMQMLEGGTLSALSDLASERDEAVGETADLKRRLEQAQKRAKSQEEAAERTQALWDKEKDAWSGEKRGLETKVQIAEGRLKVVLSEIANAQSNARPTSPERALSRSDSRNSVHESPGKKRDSRPARRASASSMYSDHLGGRVSALSFANGHHINLADELAFDEEEEYANGGMEDGRISPDALPEEQQEARPSSSLSIKARKILGLPLDFEEQDKENVDPERRPTSTYVDTAIQFSPPTSPWPRSESQLSQAMTQSMKRQSRPADLHLSNGRLSNAGAHSPTSPTDSRDSRYDSTYAPWNHTGPVMVSSGVQTVEALPSPPLTPEKSDSSLATIHESAAESIEMKTMSTQTDHSGPIAVPVPPQTDKQKSWQHVSTESGDLQIPLINIVPPTSRPATPVAGPKVVLPPRTRNADTQVDSTTLGSYTSSSMQTEVVRVDRRNIMPLSEMPSMPTTSYKAPISVRAVPPVNRRKAGPPTTTVTQRMNHAMNVGVTRMPPSNDGGPLSKEADPSSFGEPNLPRPIRSSSLFQGFDDEAKEQEDKFEVNTFPDDDIFSRPTTKLTLRGGKMVAQDGLEDIGEFLPSEIAEAVEPENLRLSEDSLSSEMRKFMGRDTQRNAPVMKPLKRVPSARSNNMRRVALISSGSAAHRASTSQSTNASAESNPPFPVPLRYSSARIIKSQSEGGRSSRASSNASPTKQSRMKKPALRKSRSGPAIAPYGQDRRSGSRSPPMASRVSIVPEMPTFQMPAEPPAFLNAPYGAPQSDASAPRPSIATGPSRRGTHVKQNSDAGLLQQTSVVDSIAQTMVGEWMFKYVRRRKSFGMGEKQDWDAGKSVDEISASVTNNGVRHKRWVWLAPYERAVMWSGKQPTSGSALMGGKSGRKLTIKSVLDVKDENPMPKGSITGPHFNRSILILTPQRALKFTALTQDRHFVWLTALSFLSHSPLSLNELNAMPPPPPPEETTAQAPAPPPSLAGTFRRRAIRDSIRIAKGAKPQQSIRSFTTDNSYPHLQEQFGDENEYYDPMNDPAMPPTIKRFHNRKRSNTAPRAPPSSFRGFSSKDVVPSLPGPGSYATSTAVTSATGSDRGLYTPSMGLPSLSSSRRGSEASASGRPMAHQLFPDSTNGNHMMRIEAFVDSKQPGFMGRGANNFGGPLGGFGGPLRNGPHKKKDMSHWGFDDPRSYSPVDSLMYQEMLAAEAPPSVPASARASEDRDYFRGF
ncbi:uncharacterized protein HMPREF1541_08247 [Cyphellophora europaea CBS 101466]|uniref:Pleckstrin homology domain-containing protein n=1 Tax=Cyphellophora europaea (strain CBS 101466) TaxID=1220924 RepID=W2RL84_CYPE1|nr:uncharacterized protein HMPREF1541_08247 [Cyphellophora europaea CBS 101466]ETN37256.1 hypothetical protein HMPREF1541_08247 [Cyphellophora europaea CBS 101466]